MPHHRKNTRLPPSHYLGQQRYFFTICCDGRKPHLCNPVLAQNVLHLLKDCAARYNFLLHAFCLMPDHVHFLAEGVLPLSDVREFVRIFKQHSAFAFRKTSPARLWERSYYDYILRPSDHVESVACYIWWNPVRKKLCARPEDFPFSGSQTIKWMKRAPAGGSWLAPWKTAEPA